MKKLHFICLRVLKEITLLADGRITTCCLDPEGKNTFSNIYEDDFEESLRKLRTFKEKLVQDADSFPHCVRCFISRKINAAAAYDQFLKENPTGEEIYNYLEEEIIPEALVIEVTNACNLTCIGCPTGILNLDKKGHSKTGKRLFIDMDKLKNWLAPCIKRLQRIRLFNYGEPLLHPGAIDISSFINQSNPRINLIISTNLLPLNNDEKIKNLVKAQPTMIIVSLHGSNPENTAKYMGPRSDFHRALQIMKKIIAERDRLKLTLPYVIWKYILFHWNDSDEEINEAKALKKEHNIDYLGFEITGGKLASKRFHKDSSDLKELKKTESYIINIYQKINRMEGERKQAPRPFFSKIPANRSRHFVNLYNKLTKKTPQVIEKSSPREKPVEKTILFLHIPKCAGTTLNMEILKKRFEPDELILFYDHNNDEITEQLKRMNREKKIKCISGHFYFGIHRYYTSRPTTYITILRDPIERIISHYYQVRRWKPHHLYRQVTEGNITLKEYVENKTTCELNNGQVRVLVGLDMNPPFGQCTGEMLAQAKENLKKHFAVVGISERFDEFLQLLGHKFGWEIPPYKNLNVSDNRKKRDDIDRETLAVIEKYNQLDMELYRFARDLFEEQYSTL